MSCKIWIEADFDEDPYPGEQRWMIVDHMSTPLYVSNLRNKGTLSGSFISASQAPGTLNNGSSRPRFGWVGLYSGSRPALTFTSASKTCADFTVKKQYLSFLHQTSSVAFVFRAESDGTLFSTWSEIGSSPGMKVCVTGSALKFDIYSGATKRMNTVSKTIVSGRAYIASCRICDLSCSVHLDGTELTSSAVGHGSDDAQPASTLRFGRSVHGSNGSKHHFNGQLLMFTAWDEYITDAEMTTVENYYITKSVGHVDVAQTLPDFWFRGDMGRQLSADKRVTKWHDISGHGHDAVQMTQRMKPYPHADLTMSNATVRFDGTRNWMSLSGSDTYSWNPPASTSGSHVFAVALNKRSAKGAQFVLETVSGSLIFAAAGNAAGSVRAPQWYDGVWEGSIASGSMEGVQLLTWRVNHSSSNGVQSSIYKDGAVVSISTSNTAIRAVSGTTVIGAAHEGTASFLHADVAEIVYYGGDMLESRFTALQSGMASRYNVAGVPGGFSGLIAAWEADDTTHMQIATCSLLSTGDMSNAAWVKHLASATYTTESAPIASLGGVSKLDELVGAGFHFVSQEPDNMSSASNPGVIVIYAKKAERTKFYISASNVAVSASFDLDAGTVMSVLGTDVTASIAYAVSGSGWYACALTSSGDSVTSYFTATTSPIFGILGPNDSVTQYAGTAGSGIYVCAPQMIQDRFVTLANKYNSGTYDLHALYLKREPIVQSAGWGGVAPCLFADGNTTAVCTTLAGQFGRPAAAANKEISIVTAVQLLTPALTSSLWSVCKRGSDLTDSYWAQNLYRTGSSVTTGIERQLVTDIDVGVSATFGGAIAIDNTTLVVGEYGATTPAGANAGAVHVYTKTGQYRHKNTWALQQTLTASDGAEVDLFGNAVSIWGDSIIVGARGDDPAGAAYVFTRTDGVWTQQQKLTSSDGAAGDLFGGAVYISSSMAVVGAGGDASSRGAAYVYTWTAPGWLERCKLTASDGAASDYLGSSEISGQNDRIVVGAYGDDSFYGAAYVYSGSGELWVEECKLTASVRATSQFGYSVDMSGSTVVVGAYIADATFKGAAYVFVQNGTNWVQTCKLTSSIRENYEFFGQPVRIENETIVAGASRHGTTDNGAVYVFTRAGADDLWTQQSKLTASNGSSNDAFGFNCDYTNGNIIISAQQKNYLGVASAGSVYDFTGSGTSWVEQDEFGNAERTWASTGNTKYYDNQGRMILGMTIAGGKFTYFYKNGAFDPTANYRNVVTGTPAHTCDLFTLFGVDHSSECVVNGMHARIGAVWVYNRQLTTSEFATASNLMATRWPVT